MAESAAVPTLAACRRLRARMAMTMAIALAWALPATGAPLAEPRPLPLDLSDTAAPVFETWDTQDGLSDEIWSTVGSDLRGYAWAGSASALARFDGQRWTLVPLPGGPSLVRDMQRDARGTLWALSESHGLLRLGDDGNWSLVDLGVGFIHRFATTSDGTLWLGYERGLARLAPDGSWRHDAGNAGLPPGVAVATATTYRLFGEARQWAGMRDGLWYRVLGRDGATGPWQSHRDSRIDAMPFTDVIATNDGGREELWLLSYGAGLARIDDEGLRLWREERGELPTEAIYSAVATTSRQGERTLWIASRAGLLRLIGDRVTAFDRRHGLPSDAVRNVKRERTPEGIDVLWVATEGGIARAALTDSRWRTVSLLGARENGIFSLLLEPDGDGGERLWVGTAKRGVGLLQDRRWRYFQYADGSLPAPGGFRGSWLLPGPDGRTQRLFGLMGNVLLRADDALVFRTVPTPWTPAESDGPAVAVARGDEAWFGMVASGTWRWRRGEWTRFALPGASAPWSVLGLLEQVDANGRSWLWAASNLGVARFDGTGWSLLPASLGLPDGGVRSVTLVPRGAQIELWAGSNRHGVVRLDVTDPAAPRRATAPAPPDAPDPTVYSVLRDSHGRLYVCTNNGVQLLVPRADAAFDAQVFRRRDGLVHDECNTNAQLLDSHDRYWAGTLGGLSVFDPSIRADTVRTSPRPLVLNELVVDGRALAPDATRVVLPPGTRELQVGWTLLAGLREGESTYRSVLEDHDVGPTEWTSARSRLLAGLAPGDYVLRVEARDYAGTAARPLSLGITVTPFWWQRASVQVAAAALALLLAWSAVLLYNRNLRAPARARARGRTAHVAAPRRQRTPHRAELRRPPHRRRESPTADGGAHRVARARRGTRVADRRDRDRRGQLQAVQRPARPSRRRRCPARHRAGARERDARAGPRRALRRRGVHVPPARCTARHRAPHRRTHARTGRSAAAAYARQRRRDRHDQRRDARPRAHARRATRGLPARRRRRLVSRESGRAELRPGLSGPNATARPAASISACRSAGRPDARDRGAPAPVRARRTR
jgi:ligand-binding sensor domain-containing protein